MAKCIWRMCQLTPTVSYGNFSLDVTIEADSPEKARKEAMEQIILAKKELDKLPFEQFSLK